MAEKRSLSQAVSFSPAEAAFINGGKEASRSKPGQEETQKEKTIELAKESEDKNGQEARSPSTKVPPKRNSHRSPTSEDVLNEMLVPLTTRMPHALVRMLRRFCLEQELQHVEPNTIQDVVTTAVQEWLTKRMN